MENRVCLEEGCGVGGEWNGKIKSRKKRRIIWREKLEKQGVVVIKDGSKFSTTNKSNSTSWIQLA